jgi:hypothetical protein
MTTKTVYPFYPSRVSPPLFSILPISKCSARKEKDNRVYLQNRIHREMEACCEVET